MFDHLRRPLFGLGLACLLASTSACSVGMALSGDENPDLGVCRVGTEQASIEEQVGPPITVRTLPDGAQSCVYEYKIGNEASPGRAIAHGAMDVLTFGLWEVVGTPVEAVQGQKYQMTVVYDADGNAREISTVKVAD